jgi:hypothetical protein
MESPVAAKARLGLSLFSGQVAKPQQGGIGVGQGIIGKQKILEIGELGLPKSVGSNAWNTHSQICADPIKKPSKFSRALYTLNKPENV